MEEGDLAVITAWLVIYVPDQCPAYKELDYNVIKELSTLLKEGCLPSYHVLSCLESLSTTYVLIPNDWESIMRMILTMMQFAIWFTDYCELCMTQVEALQDRNPPIIVVCSPYSADRLPV